MAPRATFLVEESRQRRRRARAARGAAALVVAGTLALDLLSPLGLAAGIPYLFALLLTSLDPSPRSTWAAAVAGIALSAAGFFLSPGPASAAGSWALANRALIALALAGTGWVVLAGKRREGLHHAALAGRLESLALLSGGVAHDLRNLLVPIRLLAETAESSHPEDVRESLAALDEVEALTGQLEQYAARLEGSAEPLVLADLVREAERLLRAAVSGRGRLALTCKPTGVVLADRTQVQQLLLNLVGNAADALPSEGGSVEVATGRAEDALEVPLRVSWLEDPRSPCAFLEVRDDGRGIEPHLVPRIFEPFFSTRADGKGLGLAAAFGIVRWHRGAIAVASRPGRGSLFRVLLPLAQAPDPPQSEGPSVP